MCRRRCEGRIGGFTLIEILLAIALISAVMVVMFEALSAIRVNEQRIEARKDRQKEIYFGYNALSHLLKNMSAVEIFNNRNRTPLFFGDGDEMVFISKHPLMFPYRVPHLVKVFLHLDRLEYLEAPLDVRQNFISFDVLRGEPQVLLNDIRRLSLSYLVWDPLLKREEWKATVNSFEGDGLPRQVLLEFTRNGRDERMVFVRRIHDSYDEIPEALYK
jgi:prepilin-type N-terminal cleavage/methylation domain-containing protein